MYNLGERWSINLQIFGKYENSNGKKLFKLDTRRKMDDGTYPIKIAVSYGTDLYLSTGISVSKDAWNQEAGKVISGNAKRLNDTLFCRVQNEVLALRESGRFYELSRKRLTIALRFGIFIGVCDSGPLSS